MLLLDSQAVLWLLDDNPRLGSRARELIIAASRVHVSAATVWELTIKSMLGKLRIPANFSERIEEQGLAMLSVSAAHAEGLRQFSELVRHDPFDRLLVAQAAIDNLQLVTADNVLLALKRDYIVDAAS